MWFGKSGMGRLTGCCSSSASGATLYIEPISVRANNEIKQLVKKPMRWSDFRQLPGEARAIPNEIALNINTIAQIDFIFKGETIMNIRTMPKS